MTAADVVFMGGSIFSAGMASSRSAALAVRNGRIAAVTDEVGIRDLVGPATQVVDLAGGLLLPGFQDAHVHPVMGGIELGQCNLSEASDAADCLRLIEEFAAAHPDEEWILGGGWSMDFFSGGTPTRSMLDAVVSDRPVFLMNRDHHGAWVSTAAIRLAGLDRVTPDPSDGRIERERDGFPAGVMHEGAMNLFGTVRPAIDAKTIYDGLLRGQAELFSWGVTAWQDALVGEELGQPDTLDTYIHAATSGDLRGRVTAALWWQRHRGIEQVADLVEKRARVRARADPTRLVAGSVKLMIDGIAENFTAAMSSQYLDARRHPTGNAGLSFIDPDDLVTFVTALDREGFQLHFHALGDRAVTEVLDALAAARRANGARDSRHHLAHLQVVADADLDRFAELDATANLQALWAYADAQLLDLTFPFLEQRLIDRHYPFGSLQRAGARLAAGSDWPVSSPNPMAAIHVAVNRSISSEIAPLGANQELDLATALTAYTAGSAFINNRDTNSGRLAKGYLADFAILDRDPFARPSHEISLATVSSTWIDGRKVFDVTSPETAPTST
ncbi:MAG: amidohydrolase [Rhodoglobus sp.]